MRHPGSMFRIRPMSLSIVWISFTLPRCGTSFIKVFFSFCSLQLWSNKTISCSNIFLSVAGRFAQTLPFSWHPQTRFTALSFSCCVFFFFFFFKPLICLAKESPAASDMSSVSNKTFIYRCQRGKRISFNVLVDVSWPRGWMYLLKRLAMNLVLGAD